MPFSILLTSESPIKIQALKKFLREDEKLREESRALDLNINKIKCHLPEQPYGNRCGYNCAAERIEDVYRQVEKGDTGLSARQLRMHYKYVVSIENCLTENGEDICYVLVVRGSDGMMVRGESFPVRCEPKYIQQMEKQPLVKYNDKISGYSTTLGELIQKEVPSVNPKDWVQLYNQSITREDQILDGIRNAFAQFEA